MVPVWWGNTQVNELSHRVFWPDGLLKGHLFFESNFYTSFFLFEHVKLHSIIIRRGTNEHC